MNVLVAGTDLHARRTADRLMAEANPRIRVCGFVDDHPRQVDLDALGSRYLGKLSDLKSLAIEHRVGGVVYALRRNSFSDPATWNLVGLASTLGLEFVIPLDSFHTRPGHVFYSQMAGVSAITISPRAKHRLWKLAIKRGIDVMVASLVLLATAPIWIATMIAIKLDSAGPIFFAQERVGRFGECFRFFKFRTMYVGAEAELARLRASNEQTGPVFKIQRDPRITRVGRFLRKYSIDELPQLINVLRGEMSIVGPRPPVPSEVEEYELDQRARLSMRPGLTCLWQVSGRNEIPFEDWVKLDVEYIARWSLLLDLKIMLLTIPAVLSGRGAS